MKLLDKLQRMALAIQFLRIPAIAVGLISLAAIVAIILTSRSHEGDRFLMPSIISLLWAMSSYFFLVTFRSVPKKADKSLKFFKKLKQKIYRGWYWLVGILFVGTTGAVLLVTFRMFSIWMREYGN